MGNYSSKIFIKIHEGCSDDCAFCYENYRGSQHNSYLRKHIIDKIADNSIVQLIGLNICKYQDSKGDLLSLLKDIIALGKVNKYQLNSISPSYEKRKELIEFILEDKHMSKHIILTAQSGCNETLKRMNVKYTVDDISEMIVRNLSYDIHLIVGFPGETDEEFEETLNFTSTLLSKNNRINFVPSIYKDYPDSPSFNFENKIPEHIKIIRYEIIKKLNVSENAPERFYPYYKLENLETPPAEQYSLSAFSQNSSSKNNDEPATDCGFIDKRDGEKTAGETVFNSYIINEILNDNFIVLENLKNCFALKFPPKPFEYDKFVAFLKKVHNYNENFLGYWLNELHFHYVSGNQEKFIKDSPYTLQDLIFKIINNEI